MNLKKTFSGVFLPVVFLLSCFVAHRGTAAYVDYRGEGPKSHPIKGGYLVVRADDTDRKRNDELERSKKTENQRPTTGSQDDEKKRKKTKSRFKEFEPSEKIDADQAVDFPADI
jgi:hypothetical protein